MKYLLIFSLSVSLLSADRLAIIANQNFPVKKLQKWQIKQIYLKRIRYIENIPIIPINYKAGDSFRLIFEKNLLNMSSIKLRRYWMKEHYLGKRPPIVQSSVRSAIIFVKKVDGAVAYIPYSKVTKEVRVLYILKEKP